MGSGTRIRWGVICPSCDKLGFGEEADRQTAYSKGRRRCDLFEAAATWSNAEGRGLAGSEWESCQIQPRVRQSRDLRGGYNGRVLGYDNGHDHHHRHFMGKQEPFEFTGYEALARRFYDEVRDLWRSEDEERPKSH